jgi:pyruvate/2-oxoglutarate/acetoin dehydrogenase E1 component
MDQIVNQAAKMRYMFGGKITVPMVIRTQGGAGSSCAAQHSESLESWFIHVPGLKVVMPSTPYDAKGLLKSSIRDDNVVIFIEHNLLYNNKGEVPEEEYLVPLGNADIKREGTDVTVIADSRIVLHALEAAATLAEEGISVELIDLRTITPLDIDTITESVKKTGRVVICEADCKTGGVGAEVLSQIVEHVFDYLDGPIIRVAGRDTPIPYSPLLESVAVPDKDDIIKAVKELL